jgi:hypothetical protein
MRGVDMFTGILVESYVEEVPDEGGGSGTA